MNIFISVILFLIAINIPFCQAKLLTGIQFLLAIRYYYGTITVALR